MKSDILRNGKYHLLSFDSTICFSGNGGVHFPRTCLSGKILSASIFLNDILKPTPFLPLMARALWPRKSHTHSPSLSMTSTRNLHISARSSVWRKWRRPRRRSWWFWASLGLVTAHSKLPSLLRTLRCSLVIPLLRPWPSRSWAWGKVTSVCYSLLETMVWLFAKWKWWVWVIYVPLNSPRKS